MATLTTVETNLNEARHQRLTKGPETNFEGGLKQTNKNWQTKRLGTKTIADGTNA